MADLSGRENSGGLDEGALPIRLLHDRVLVSTDNEPGERRSSGGILIRGDRRNRPSARLG